MSTAIFIKSYPRDYQWLAFCLKSIQKFARGFSEIIVALPEGQTLPLTQEKIVNVKERGQGYYWQMVVKMHADDFTDADHILYIDSDCVLTREFNAEEMFYCGKPKLLRRRWEDAGDGICWKPVAEAALGQPCLFDTMACHPSIYSRETLRRTRQRIRDVHGMDLKRYAVLAPKFIEFVTVGNMILQDHPEEYDIIDCGPHDEYPRPISQAWSWGGMSAEKRAELERITS